MTSQLETGMHSLHGDTPLERTGFYRPFKAEAVRTELNVAALEASSAASQQIIEEHLPEEQALALKNGLVLAEGFALLTHGGIAGPAQPEAPWPKPQTEHQTNQQKPARRAFLGHLAIAGRALRFRH